MCDIRPIDLSSEGIDQTCELLSVVFPHAVHLTPDYLTRLYFGNPVGETWGLSGFDADGRLVAHSIMIPIKARVHGREEVGIWPFQLATHPQARMKGLFVAMTEATHVEAVSRGFTFQSGVGNQASTPVFVKKWGYQSVCPLDVKIGVGAVPASRPLQDCDFRRVWDDPRAIAWRLEHHQSSPYSVRYVGDIGHIYANTGRLGIRAELGAFHRDLLPADLAEHESLNPLRMWIGRDPSRDWSRSLFFDLPVRLRPSPLNLLWHDLTGQSRTHDPERVQYDLFDFDAY